MTRSAFSKTAIFSLLCGAAAGLLGFQLEQKNERSVPLKLYVATSQAIYCGSSDVGGVLQLRVQVRYVNVGSRPIILLRDVTSITEVNLKKESGPGDDLKFSVTNATSFPKIPEDQSTPGKRFAILKQGQELSVLAMVPIPYNLESSPRPGVRPGYYRVVVKVAGWDEGQNSLVFADKWRSSGDLWSLPVSSEPFKLHVEESPRAQECN